ncbi:hypothetical protein BDZ45DRAFT_706293 [Acephala macrosclerotiorum]|nr:hypothetical protein BDZ45DRAFT_706293 [Acephala macrosclerotiorum]
MNSEICRVSPVSRPKPIVVGLYGILGSGKTHLLSQLKQILDHRKFTFFKRSDFFSRAVPGGLEAFKKLEEQKKVQWRNRAIGNIRKECRTSGKDGETGSHVLTSNDLQVHTHIIYLQIDSAVISKRTLDDDASKRRQRSQPSIDHLRWWQQAEHHILFTKLLEDFSIHDENHNILRVDKALDEAFNVNLTGLETVPVIDSDKTLAAEDTDVFSNDPLTGVFSSPFDHTYSAFRQAMLLYEDFLHRVGQGLSFQEALSGEKHVGAVVVTCGLRCTWEMILEQAGLSDTVKVIVYRKIVRAFVDSKVDLEMLAKAGHGIVVIGEEHTRSKSMDIHLQGAIFEGWLRAHLILLPSNTTPRLDIFQFPLVRFTDQDFEEAVSHQCRQVAHDANQRRDSCWPIVARGTSTCWGYLATNYFTDVIGIKEDFITHVQGHETIGHRLKHEYRTSIVALMRGGRPMALGINDSFPLASFIHASHLTDLNFYQFEN